MNLLIMGPPGAGKGSQAAKIISAYGIPHISTGDMFREAIKSGTPLGLEAKRYIDAGELVPDEVTNGIVKERLQQADCRKGFLLDGYPRTINQAVALDEMLHTLGKKIDAVLNMECSEETIIKRIAGRRICQQCGATYHILNHPPKVENVCDRCGGALYQRKDDNPDTVKNRLEVYYKQTAPLIEYYRSKGNLIMLDGNLEIDELFIDVKRILDGLK
ncbi:MAG TPA: adenylate kinase [Haloplasmataceae bacterium]